MARKQLAAGTAEPLFQSTALREQEVALRSGERLEFEMGMAIALPLFLIASAVGVCIIDRGPTPKV